MVYGDFSVNSELPRSAPLSHTSEMSRVLLVDCRESLGKGRAGESGSVAIYALQGVRLELFRRCEKLVWLPWDITHVGMVREPGLCVS